MRVRLKVDSLGRVTIPKVIRDAIGYSACDSFVVAIEGDQVILKKTTENCSFCDKSAAVVFKEKQFCSTCFFELKQTENPT